MLCNQALIRNTPRFVRCLSRGATGAPIITSKKEILDKQKTKPSPSEVKPVSRRLKSASKKKQEKTKTTSKYLPLSALPHFPNPEEARMGRPRGIDFQIPKESLKSSEVKISKEFDKEARDLAGKIESFSQKEADDQALIAISKEIGKYLEPELNRMYPTKEHPMRKSLSGMSKINPTLDKIEDSYLWEILPPKKSFGIPPYQRGDPLGFKEWENKLIEKEEKKQLEDEAYKKKYGKMMAEVSDADSFITSKRGARKRINRKLLKNYKKLEKDAKLPAKDKLVIEVIKL
ncbi:hypothetical protein FOB64_000388 [Candida albicans]|uniref:Uncharacterized protein n=2 Tax=Candida albicans TaxID=5476 RepID=Q59SS9_CANAL|nr:uncharacterized protein CAALFM_C303770CA [Candida albicans SC5314]AOW28404.1 hypothetical protein CAALFM_C303770CA [Candida albicans SC5314]KAF6072341.1 hypothetical protein FOB64_000388 [Candida albicans]|eukprot:XP_712740.1 hypothetical protein CAALFM_C303770CA [Candida albicans SC5314]